VATMLDSLVDQAEDAETGDHQYVSHYGDTKMAVGHIAGLVAEAGRRMVELRRGHAHAVVVGGMVPFYLSEARARTAAMRPHTAQISRSGGSLVRVLAPILRTWRLAYSQASA